MGPSGLGGMGVMGMGDPMSDLYSGNQMAASLLAQSKLFIGLALMN